MQTERGLAGTLYSGDDLDELAALLAQNPSEDEDDGPGMGGRFEKAIFELTAPSVEPEPGAMYRLGKVILCVLDPAREWEAATQHLKPGMLWVPYPGALIPYLEELQEKGAVLMQPDRWIAGHLLDR